MTIDKTSNPLGGSWIVDAGPNQVKTITTYTPVQRGMYVASENVFNFDWTLGGLKPTATHGTQLTGVVEDHGEKISFVLIAYVLDNQEKAVYIFKATGNKILKDEDTISVINLVFHVYEDPENCNPVTDKAHFTIPPEGSFPPIHEYRIKGE
jgi:hypothetical protein